MRILVSVFEDTLVTAAPSEPILAIAAADALTENMETYAKAYRTLLVELIRPGLVLDTGDQDGLCSRLLVLLTRDMATIKFRSAFVAHGEDDDRINAISLDEFLTTLLATNDEDFHFGFAKTQFALAAELRKFCKGKWINLTHYIKYTKHVEELTLDDLEHTWFTGAAIQFTHDQPVIDGGFVVYDGPLDEPYNRLNLLFVPYQTKARKGSAGKSIGAGLTAPPILHPDGKSGFKRVKPQTIVLLMDFGGKMSFEGSGGHTTRLERRVAKTNDWWAGYADPKMGEEEPENFLLNIRGCSQMQYPVLRNFTDTFESLSGRVLKGQLPTELREMEIEMMQTMYPIEGQAKKIKGEVDDSNDPSEFDPRPVEKSPSECKDVS